MLADKRTDDSASEDDDDHYLDADVRSTLLAQEFMTLHVDSVGTQQGAVKPAGDQVHVKCGCSQDCLNKMDWEAVQANRLTMCELDKGERRFLFLACTDDLTHSPRSSHAML